MDVSHLCSFYLKPLRTWIKINVNKLAIWDHTTLNLAIQTLRKLFEINFRICLSYLAKHKRWQTSRGLTFV